MEYSFYIDQKVMVWNRTYYTIEARDKKAAIKKAKQMFEGAKELPDPDSFDTLHDSEQIIDPTPGNETCQLFDDETDELLLTNAI